MFIVLLAVGIVSPPTVLFDTQGLRAVIASFVIGGLILQFAILAAPGLTAPEIGQVGGLQFVGPAVLGVVFAVTVCAPAVHTAAIQLMIAMARDNAPPAGARLARTDPKRRTPVVPAVLIGAVITIGPAGHLARGRHQVGTPPEHMAKNLEQAP